MNVVLVKCVLQLNQLSPIVLQFLPIFLNAKRGWTIEYSFSVSKNSDIHKNNFRISFFLLSVHKPMFLAFVRATVGFKPRKIGSCLKYNTEISNNSRYLVYSALRPPLKETAHDFEGWNSSGWYKCLMTEFFAAVYQIWKFVLNNNLQKSFISYKCRRFPNNPSASFHLTLTFTYLLTQFSTMSLSLWTLTAPIMSRESLQVIRQSRWNIFAGSTVCMI